MPAPVCTKSAWYKAADASCIDSDPETWRAVFALLNRPWFDRQWIIQEIQLANPYALVQCSKDTITWRQLRRAILVCARMKFPHGTPPSLNEVFDNRYNLAFVAKGNNPIELLSDAKFAQCSDPRDRIFALLGLLPHALSKKIQPRYTDSSREVYHEATVAYIECSSSLDILTLAGPSWIPDWVVPQNVLGYEGRYSSSHSAAEVSYVAPNVMVAAGVLFDAVEAVAGPGRDDERNIVGMVRKVWLTQEMHTHMYLNGQSLVEASAWTLNDYVRERWPKADRIANMAEAQLLLQRLQEDGDVITGPDDSFNTRRISGSSLFRTTKGYFGRSPAAAKPGDQICVLLGSSLATILRAQPDGKLLFIGCAYVHGIMDGEALIGPLGDGWKVTVQTDRNGDTKQYFVDPNTNRPTSVDPRLPPLPQEWQHVVAPDRFWPDKKVDAFRNTDTGEIMHSDPRLLPDALRARGVPLKNFALV